MKHQLTSELAITNNYTLMLNWMMFVTAYKITEKTGRGLRRRGVGIATL